MKNILITGGAGFIGSNIASKLYDLGYSVTVLDNLSPQIHGSNAKLPVKLSDKVKFINGDVCELSSWESAIKNQDAIIHLAAETGTGQSMYEIQKYTSVNIGGTAIMLDYLANNEHSISKVIVASSRAIYGEGKYQCRVHGIVYPNSRDGVHMNTGDFEVKCPICNNNVELMPTDENSRINPGSIYGITKLTQEQMVLTTCKSLNIPAVALRYQNVYGPGQSLSNPYTGILSIFSTRIMNNNEINIFEDGKESRDFVYIDDVVNATILCLENKEADHEVFNIGSGRATDVFTVANTLKKYFSSSVDIRVSGSYRLGDIRHNLADLSKIEYKLNYKPSVLFSDGISKFVEWVQEQETQDDNYEISIEEMRNRGLFRDK